MRNLLMCLFAILLMPTIGWSADDDAVRAVPDTIEPVKLKNKKPRNVVFILSDDHRYDAMSFLGHQFAETPHMDAMAANGVHFETRWLRHLFVLPVAHRF